MVAIIGCPAQCELRQVTRTKHETIHLIGEVHQYLGALTRLAVLIGHIMYFGVMVDVLEMLGHSSGNADFMQCHTQGFDHRTSVSIGAVGSAETWHGNGMNGLAVTPHAVHGTDGDQQRQC